MTATVSLSHPPRILLVRLSAIGDVIHGMPAACALRDAFPDAHLAWVVETGPAPLLEGHPALNKVIAVPKGFLKSPGKTWRLRKQLRASRFDVAIDLQGLTKSAVVAWLSGASSRIGYGGPDGRELSPLFNNTRIAPTASHVIDRSLELLAPLGLVQPAVRFDVPKNPSAEAKVTRWIADKDCPDRFAVVNPGAGWPSKRWPRDRYALLVKHLREEHHLETIVVWAGETENAWARAILDAAGSGRLAPPTDLPALAALLRRACICIGSDTGPVHLAAAVGTPCVALYGPMPAERNGPYGTGHRTLQNMRVEGSSRDRRNAGPASMEAISTAEVCAACDTLLQNN